MKKTTQLLLLATLIIATAFSASAKPTDKLYLAVLGCYGIELQNKADGYDQYVGQEVEYLGIAYDDFKAQTGDRMAITKITEGSETLAIELQRIADKKKFKMTAYTANHLSGGLWRSQFVIMHNISVPLLLVNKFEEDKKLYLNEPFTGKNGKSYTVTKLEVNNTASSNLVFLYESYMVNGDSSNLHSYNAAYNNLIGTLGVRFTSDKATGYYDIVNYKYDVNKEEVMAVASYNGTGEEVECPLRDIVETNGECFFQNDLQQSLNVALTNVIKPESPKVTKGEISSVTENDSTAYGYEDNMIQIMFVPSDVEFDFLLNNISGSTLRLLWDEAVFVDYDGTTSKVLHNGIKYSEMNEPMQPSVIINESMLDDVAEPTSYVELNSTTNQWDEKPIFTHEGTVKLMLPLQLKNETLEYIFEFTVSKQYAHPDRVKE